MSTQAINPDHDPQERKRAQRGRPSTKRPQLPGVPKQWQCDWPACQKSFGRKSDLIRHHHTHTGTRNHRCPYSECGKTFIQTSALTVHIRTHTGEKPHECQVCGKRFSDSSSLARHRKIHSNERPYPCKVDKCDKSFCRKSTLNKHMDREHPGVAHSPLTEESEDETSAGSQGITTTSFTSDEPMVSSMEAISLQAMDGTPLVKAEFDTYGGVNPAQFRRIAQQPHPVTTGDYYSQTQPSTPTMATWNTIDGQQRPANMHARTSRVVPVPLKPFNSAPGMHEPGPMSAPILYPDQQYRGHPSMLQSASYMPQDFAQQYYSDVSGAPSPMHHQQDMRASSIDQGQNIGMVHPPMLPQTHTGSNDAQRVLQSHMKAEQLVHPMQQQQPMTQPEAEIYSYAPSDYQEPMDLGVTGFTQHYALPATDMGTFGIDDEDKYADTFGEPTPAQLAANWAY